MVKSLRISKNFRTVHRPCYAAQLSETRLEPAGTTASEMGSKSEYPTIGAISHIGGVTF